MKKVKLFEEFLTNVNEDLRTNLKKYIKRNNDELNRLADADDWDKIYSMIFSEFEVEDGSEEAKEIKTIFNIVF